MRSFTKVIARLKQYYGEPEPPAANGPFELVLWENCCYLLPDERRFEVFTTLRDEVGLNAVAISAAPDRQLLPIAKRGGMRPETRVFRWRDIAQITLTQYAGDLNSILDLPSTEAKKALKQFPAIGDPGAEKILLLCGAWSGLPLESNGLRVLGRLGWGRLQRNYGATYRSVQEDLKSEVPKSAGRLKEAHLLLRIHGKTLCKDKSPVCHQCPLAAECSYPQPMSSKPDAG